MLPTRCYSTSEKQQVQQYKDRYSKDDRKPEEQGDVLERFGGIRVCVVNSLHIMSPARGFLLMQTAILSLLVVAVKLIDWRQTVWIFRNPGFRELNPLITSEAMIVPVMATITGGALLLGYFEVTALWVYLIASTFVVLRNAWIGVRFA